MNHPKKVESKRSSGSQFELQAEHFLVKKGYRILNRNVNYRCGEIDLVAEKDKILTFIEVRMRDAGAVIHPIETLSVTKMNRLRRAIQVYLLSYRGDAAVLQIDLLSIRTDPVQGQWIDHFQNVTSN
jgi:putative endonuclease